MNPFVLFACHYHRLTEGFALPLRLLLDGHELIRVALAPPGGVCMVQSPEARKEYEAAQGCQSYPLMIQSTISALNCASDWQ